MSKSLQTLFTQSVTCLQAGDITQECKNFMSFFSIWSPNPVCRMTGLIVFLTESGIHLIYKNISYCW